MSIFFDGLAGYALLVAVTYALLMITYFAEGTLFERLGARHPERRIQTRPFSDKKTDIRQSTRSLFSIAIYVAGGLWLQANGYTLFAVWKLSWASLLFGLIISIVLYDAWFYWFHRLMHTKRFYRFHAQHHVSVAPTPWSNNNDTLTGTFFEQAYFLIAPLVLPFPALVFIIHKAWDQISGMIGHAGYEFFASPTARRPWPGVCTTYHDQHHAYFRFNFANTFTYWDRLFGTLHPGYDARVKEFEEIASHGK